MISRSDRTIEIHSPKKRRGKDRIYKCNREKADNQANIYPFKALSICRSAWRRYLADHGSLPSFQHFSIRQARITLCLRNSSTLLGQNLQEMVQNALKVLIKIIIAVRFNKQIMGRAAVPCFVKYSIDRPCLQSRNQNNCPL